MERPERKYSILKKIWTRKKAILGSAIICVVLLSPFLLLLDNLYAQTNTHIGSFPTSDTSLTLATFNIHQFWDEQDRPTKLNNLRDLIQSEDIDIIGLQEMWQDNASYLASELNMSYFTPPTTQDDTFYGLALLSKYPILATQTLSLNSSNPNFMRAMIWATIQFKNENLTIYVTHLDTPASYLSQLQQSRQIVNITDNGSDPILLCDCNSPDTVFLESYRILTEHFEDSWIVSGKRTFEGRTWPSDNPFLRVDYIWLSKNGWSVQEGSGKTFGNASYSDHLGVKVTISKK